jgi:hypothetical protein
LSQQSSKRSWTWPTGQRSVMRVLTYLLLSVL